MHQKLTQKKWDSHDIKKTIVILKSAKRSSQKNKSHINHALILVSLGAMGLGNLLVAIVIIPLMLGFSGWFLFSLVILLGVMMGLLFEVLTRSIESLQIEHHLLFSLVMPFLALTSVLFMASFAQESSVLFGIKNVSSPHTVAFLYAFSFLLPYAYAKFILKKHYYSN